MRTNKELDEDIGRAYSMLRTIEKVLEDLPRELLRVEKGIKDCKKPNGMVSTYKEVREKAREEFGITYDSVRKWILDEVRTIVREELKGHHFTVGATLKDELESRVAHIVSKKLKSVL